MSVTKTEAKKALRLRAAGKSWAEIMDEMDKPRSFVIAVRPLMKEIDPTSVAPSYDRRKRNGRRKTK